MAVDMEIVNDKPPAPQEARDEMKAILKRLIEFNDRWNGGKYLTIGLVNEGRPSQYGPLGADTISYNNAYWESETTCRLDNSYEQDELRAEIAITAKGA